MVKRASRKRARSSTSSWPTRAAAAAELSVLLNQPTFTVETMKGWLVDPACPLPRGRGPIPKAPIFQYLLVKRGPGRPADPGSSKAKDAQAAIWQAKADVIRGKVVKWSSVNDAIAAAVTELRRDLTEEIPTAIGEMIGKRQPDEIVEEARALGVAALNRFAQRARPAASA